MITGMHTIFYTPKADELRAFVRDKLGFPFTDVGGGWLIFDLPEADMGCHPSEHVAHEISFYCKDIDATVAELKARGVQFSSNITYREYGRVTSFLMPGGLEVELYEPSYDKESIDASE